MAKVSGDDSATDIQMNGGLKEACLVDVEVGAAVAGPLAMKPAAGKDLLNAARRRTRATRRLLLWQRTFLGSISVGLSFVVCLLNALAVLSFHRATGVRLPTGFLAAVACMWPANTMVALPDSVRP